MLEDRLEQLVTDWKHNGSRSQEPIEWSKNRSNWIRDLPEISEFIAKLPSKLNRFDVSRIFEDSGSTVETRFATVMIWGYGTVGYGSYRVKRMFASSDFDRKILKSYELAQEGRPLDSYSYLSKNRIEWLGPAFATKWISFSSPKIQQSPIYDSFISKWFQAFGSQAFGEINLSSINWNLETYSIFVQFMSEQAERLQVTTNQLEMIIFQDAMQSIPNSSRWRNL